MRDGPQLTPTHSHINKHVRTMGGLSAAWRKRSLLVVGAICLLATLSAIWPGGSRNDLCKKHQQQAQDFQVRRDARSTAWNDTCANPHSGGMLGLLPRMN